MSVSETKRSLEIANVPQPPHGHWRWSQTWREVFFAHWQVSADSVRPHLPAGLEIDTQSGMAWVSLVAFRLDVWHRWLPSFGLTTNFVEINLRTYVRCRDEPGIYFLSIHAGRRASVALARLLTPLPYVYAPVVYTSSFESHQLECLRDQTHLLRAEFSPTGLPGRAARHSLDAWLLERYRGFAASRDKLQRMVAQHAPWSLQSVKARIIANELGRPWGLNLRRQPDAAHFSLRMPALVWPFETVRAGLA